MINSVGPSPNPNPLNPLTKEGQPNQRAHIPRTAFQIEDLKSSMHQDTSVYSDKWRQLGLLVIFSFLVGLFQN